MRLRYSLPLAQVGLAMFLLERGYAWEQAMMRIQDMPGPSPAVKLLGSINFPVMLVRLFWILYLPDRLDIILLAVIGLFWFWIALNVESWRKQREVRNFSSRPLSLTADILLIGIGVLGGYAAWQETFRSYSSTLDHWFFVRLAIQLTWSATFVFFFGWDFVGRLLRRERASKIAAH